MSEQKICPTCGTEYPLSERFCPRDGTALRSANASGDLLGTVVAERYHVLKKLGEGGMGTVYLAEHVKMGRKSALKVMNPGMTADPDAIARFNREAANASRLSHPNICAIYDFGETSEGLIYLAMEFIEGKPLTDLIEAAGGLAPARAGSIVHQAADALQVAHDAGIVHRDLKPDNIMVARHRDGSDLVKVVDFGIAKASSSDAQKVTKTGLVVGTPEYMSPEQLAGDKLDGRSDIYSLALVAFNCLTGKLPFPSETAQEAMIMRLTDRPRTLSEMRPDIAWPEAVQRVMDHALARDAAERYQGAAQFGREFAAALQAMPSVAATEGATLVVGAQTAAAAAAAATKAVPATRVSKHESAAAPAAPPERGSPPAKKSSALPMLVGGVAVVVAATLGYLKFAQGGTGEADAAAAVATQDASGASDPGRDPARTGGDSAGMGVPMSRPMNPVASETRTAGRETPAPSPAASQAPSAPDAATVAAQRVRDLRTRVETAPEADADRIGRAAIPELEALLPSLSGSPLHEAQYALMSAYFAVEDEAGICRMSAQVLRAPFDDNARTLATTLRSTYGCK